MQAGIRAFIVDNAPPHQQEDANAWASRLTGVGNILGYIFGYIDLPRYLPIFGGTQFKVLCALASLSLIGTLAISCLYIKERDPRLDGPPKGGDDGIISFFKQVLKSVRHLPPQIARVCEVQVAAWIGWFPFLFYATTYIGQLYVNPIFEEHPDLSEDQINELWEKATRIGTFALLIYAIMSFVANIGLPLLVVPTYKRIVVSDELRPDGSPEEVPTANPTESHLHAAVGKADETDEKPSWLTKLQIPGLTLRRTWLLSHILFAVCTFSTFFIWTYQAGTVVVGLIGISWALSLWAPFALISAEVSRIEAEHRIHRHQAGLRYSTSPRQSHNPSAHLNEDLENSLDPQDAKDTGDQENLAQAGIILGLHNVAVSAPQILSSLICSGIFKLAQKPRGEPWDDSVGWVLRFGGCAALIAAGLCTRLSEGARGVPVAV